GERTGRPMGDAGSDRGRPDANEPAGLPARIRLHLSRLHRQRAQASTRTTSIRHALEFARRGVPRRALLFLISDFFDSGYDGALRTANRRHDVVAVQVSDPREHEMPPAGLVTLEDAETGQLRAVDTRGPVFGESLRRASERRSVALASEF